jgi:hypothetical protein
MRFDTTRLCKSFEVIFGSRKTGRGIWKWIHYFDIYHHHFSKYIGRDVCVLEIGVYSGGSASKCGGTISVQSVVYMALGIKSLSGLCPY